MSLDRLSRHDLLLYGVPFLQDMECMGMEGNLSLFYGIEQASMKARLQSI